MMQKNKKRFFFIAAAGMLLFALLWQLMFSGRENASTSQLSTSSPSGQWQDQRSEVYPSAILAERASNDATAMRFAESAHAAFDELSQQSFDNLFASRFGVLPPSGTPPPPELPPTPVETPDLRGLQIRFHQLEEDVHVMRTYGVEPPPDVSFPVPFEVGIQIDGCNRPIAPALDLVVEHHFRWVKQQVRWADLEFLDNRLRRIRWECLDALVSEAEKRNLRIMLSVVTTPRYLRPFGTKTSLGPPRDLQAWAGFLDALVKRYKGRIHAIEVWNEPNLDAEWEEGVSAESYLRLLRVAYVVIKRQDPNIMVIHAGLAPMNHDKPPYYWNDITFLERLSDQGGFLWFDCLGYHANGPPGMGYTEEVLARYYEKIFSVQDPKLRRPLCMTEYSYSLPIGGQTPPDFAWAIRHTEEEQAQLLVHWTRMMKDSGVVRLAFIFNLNYADGITPNSIAALSRPDLKGLALKSLGDYLMRLETHRAP